MAAGTKIFLALAALFIGAVVLYYGVLTPPAEPTIERSNTDSTADAARDEPPAAFRNAVAPGPTADRTVSRSGWTSGDGQPTRDAAPAKTSTAVNETLAREEPPAPWTAPRPPVALGDRHVMEDGGKDTPDSGFVGPPIPSDYARRTVAANTPISTNDPQPMTVREQRIEAATRGPDPALTRTTTMQPTAASASRHSTYTVRPGDTLVYIAYDWFGDGEKWDLIVDANPELANPDRLQVGQVLKLPPKNAVRTPTTSADRRGGGTYTVRSGDTLSVIAWKQYGEGSAWKLIYDANRTAIGPNPDRLKVGMKLTIPARTDASNGRGRT